MLFGLPHPNPDPNPDPNPEQVSGAASRSTLCPIGGGRALGSTSRRTRERGCRLASSTLCGRAPYLLRAIWLWLGLGLGLGLGLAMWVRVRVRVSHVWARALLAMAMAMAVRTGMPTVRLRVGGCPYLLRETAIPSHMGCGPVHQSVGPRVSVV